MFGGAIGFGFAALALCLSVVSLPLLLDRDVGLVPAVGASLRTARENPEAVALWGLIVAAALILGSLPLFIGLAVVMPVLGSCDLAALSPRDRPRSGARGSDRRPEVGRHEKPGLAGRLDFPGCARIPTPRKRVPSGR